MGETELLHLQTRKKISEIVKMTRNVGEGEVGVAVCSAKEKSSDEAHDGWVPGATRPDIHNRHVVRMNDHVLIPEMVGPGEESAEKSQKFPEVDVERVRVWEPGNSVEGGEWEGEPTVTKDCTDAEGRSVGEQMDVVTGNWKVLEESGAVPVWEKVAPPIHICSCL